jgi:hypothetical protein
MDVSAVGNAITVVVAVFVVGPVKQLMVLRHVQHDQRTRRRRLNVRGYGLNGRVARRGRYRSMAERGQHDRVHQHNADGLFDELTHGVSSKGKALVWRNRTHCSSNGRKYDCMTTWVCSEAPKPRAVMRKNVLVPEPRSINSIKYSG